MKVIVVEVHHTDRPESAWKNAPDGDRLIKRNGAKNEGEYVITGVRKDGSRFRAELHSKQGHIGDRPVRFVAVRDVTERERTSALLRESERRFRDLARAAFDFTVFSRDGVVLEVDGDTRPVLGVAPEQMVGRSILDFTAPSAQPLVQQRIQEGALGTYEAVALHEFEVIKSAVEANAFTPPAEEIAS